MAGFQVSPPCRCPCCSSCRCCCSCFCCWAVACQAARKPGSPGLRACLHMHHGATQSSHPSPCRPRPPARPQGCVSHHSDADAAQGAHPQHCAASLPTRPAAPPLLSRQARRRRRPGLPVLLHQRERGQGRPGPARYAAAAAAVQLNFMSTRKDMPTCGAPSQLPRGPIRRFYPFPFPDVPCCPIHSIEPPLLVAPHRAAAMLSP